MGKAKGEMMATRTKKLTRLQTTKNALDTATYELDKARRELENEQIARKGAEDQNAVLAALCKEHVKAANTLAEVGQLMHRLFDYEISFKKHDGQTLAETLEMYLGGSRRSWQNRVVRWMARHA
jgi:hypothetical protein